MPTATLRSRAVDFVGRRHHVEHDVGLGKRLVVGAGSI